jgi:hypothetical protein
MQEACKGFCRYYAEIRFFHILGTYYLEYLHTCQNNVYVYSLYTNYI